MGRPAARRGDLTSHTSSLRGTGWVSVKIGGNPAWRAYDVHTCNMQNFTPSTPPAPVPHGTGAALKGSLGVLVGGQPAARQGDVVLEPACAPPTTPHPPNNAIVAGCATVLVGDIAFGMTSPEVLADFCRGWNQLMADWDDLTPAQRQQRMTDLINESLERSGVPPVNNVLASEPPGAGVYRFTEHTIGIPAGTFAGGRPSPRVAGVLVHEARHAQQWYNAARHLASGGMTPNAVHAATGIHRQVCGRAVDAVRGAGPGGLDPLASQHGRMTYDSYYGRGQDFNGRIRNAPINSHDDLRTYFGLPEERDAEEAHVALNHHGGPCAAAHDPDYTPPW